MLVLFYSKFWSQFACLFSVVGVVLFGIYFWRYCLRSVFGVEMWNFLPCKRQQQQQHNKRPTSSNRQPTNTNYTIFVEVIRSRKNGNYNNEELPQAEEQSRITAIPARLGSRKQSLLKMAIGKERLWFEGLRH